ncbi:ABC transporter substrate-binding protein [Sulfurimonas sp.]|nr:ABC transporter substrate-binding protein [Sulfurimonas sp.]
MHKYKKLLLLLIISLTFISCSSEYDKKLKISATTWIGYTPLYYAQEMGWLDELNIKLLNVSSLSENMYIYKSGNSDAYVGTQYEYNLLSKSDHSLKPIMMFDRSYGGDIIMSNTSIKTLQSTTGQIEAYLEMDSINSTILEDFLSKYKIDGKKIKYTNMDQAEIKTLKVENVNTNSLIITYIPYNYQLEENGFKEIASTKDSLDIFVVDAMFTTHKTLYKHKKQFIELKKLVDRAVTVVNNNPKAFFEKIKPYMLDITYDEFVDSLNDIIWINKDMNDNVKQRMEKAKLPTVNLL